MNDEASADDQCPKCDATVMSVEWVMSTTADTPTQ